MTEQKHESDQRSEAETRKIMDGALKRALNTPHRPHKPKTSATASKAASKPRRKKGSGV